MNYLFTSTAVTKLNRLGPPIKRLYKFHHASAVCSLISRPLLLKPFHGAALAPRSSGLAFLSCGPLSSWPWEHKSGKRPQLQDFILAKSKSQLVHLRRELFSLCANNGRLGTGPPFSTVLSSLTSTSRHLCTQGTFHAAEPSANFRPL